jgi:hypothetical protein
MDKNDIKNLFGTEEEINKIAKETPMTDTAVTTEEQVATTQVAVETKDTVAKPKKKRTRNTMPPEQVREISEKIFDGRLTKNKTYNQIAQEIGITTQQLTGIIAKKRGQYKLELKKIAESQKSDAEKKQLSSFVNEWLKSHCPIKEPKKRVEQPVLSCEKELMDKLNSLRK